MNSDAAWLEWLVAILQGRPVLLLSLVPLPLIGIAAIWRIYPHTPLIILFAAATLLATGLFVSDEVVWLLVATDLGIITVALIDLATMARTTSVSVERETGRIASINLKHEVTLVVVNRHRRTFIAWLRDDVPRDYDPSPQQFALRLAGGSRCRLRYSMRPAVRGLCILERVYLRVRSSLGLWHQFSEMHLPSEIRVYPDMKQMAEYALLARSNRLSLMGVRRTRRVGQDNEFERLRDYTPDDNYKHIDWRATARRSKLTVRDFQSNQSQRLVFLLDCGRMMTTEVRDLSFLDHALNAILMLSFVALRQGDSVGLLAFSDAIHSYVPPRGGSNQMNRLLHASYDRFPQLVESRYDEAFLYLAAKCRKRSLVILISNLIDEVNANQIVDHLSTLSGRHLPLGILLRDHHLFEAVEGPFASNEQLFRAAAAADILAWRHQVLSDLQQQGVLSMDVFPDQMTAPLVNRYLEIKARHLL